MSSSATTSKIPQTGMIITDDVAPQPILDFKAYSNTIVKMIKESRPKFSIGIYGEWGSGKTTLLKVIEDKLNQENNNDEDILTVWFNAWRYEREEQFALVSLLKTIAYKMDELPKYKKLKEILFKSAITAAKGFTSKYIFSDKYVDEIEKNLTSEMMALAKEDKNTIYFQGMKQIEDIMKNIIESSPKSRIVVFIDDLDRCSPKKALEVFESIKVFLGIDGFVYIIGL
jgi:predicted KAP-like P-loop ATPase